MYCADMEDFLSPYLDHELFPEEHSFVEKHLQHCTSCREALEELQETSRMFRSLPNVPMPEGFQDQFHKMLVLADRDLYGKREDSIKKSWLQRIFGSYRLVSAGMILILCLTVYSFSALQKNKTQMDQFSYLSSAEITKGQTDSAGTESTEKALQPELDANQKAVIQNNQSQSVTEVESGMSRDQLFLAFALAVVGSFLIMKIISRFIKKTWLAPSLWRRRKP